MSGLRIFTSNRLEILAAQLAARLSSEPLPPMAKDIVVVQSRGMQRWLNLELARLNRISANIEYPYPRAFLYRQFRKVMDLPEKSPFDPETMTWRILKQLPQVQDLPGFEGLKHYTMDDPAGLKAYQLAEKIARMFDHYLIYRADMIDRWERGKNPEAETESDARWQAELWRRILDDSGDKHPIHDAALKARFMELKGPREGLPARIGIFGMSTLPPFFLEIFARMAEEIEVNFYYLNPCKNFWEYVFNKKEILRFTRDGIAEEDLYLEEGNALLASMGVSGREFFSQIMRSPEDIGEALFEDPGENTILACIQSDILNLRNRVKPADGKGPVFDGDRSVRIHVCHGPLREVEVLRDALLALFDAKPDLLPRDIVVMMPDVAAYAPLIRAVFDAPEDEANRMPYSIADNYRRSTNAVADAFLSILAIGQRRFRAPDILDILETPAVRRKFDFSEEDPAAARRWIRETGICWGIDGEYRKRIGLPPFRENTWRFGLDRMLLGHALPPEDEHAVFMGIQPYGEIEGENVFTMGNLWRFAESLFHWSERLRTDRSPGEWAEILNNLIAEMFAEDDESSADIKELRDALMDAGLAGHGARAGFEGAVSLEVVRHYLAGRFERESQEHGYIRSGITFCSLAPMRSIPFRVLCLLGMNDGEYPRRESRPNFDLMGRRRRMGDRSKRDEDRYLFLECLLSAREHLIISYVGRSIQDNAEIPPSVLVRELQDYLMQGFNGKDGKSILDPLTVVHPLQPFSPAYFRGDGRVFSYSTVDFRAAQARARGVTDRVAFIAEPLPPQMNGERPTIHIGALIQFFRNPAEYLLRNRLNMNLKLDDADRPGEREPFELDNLEEYGIREGLVKTLLKGGDADDQYEIQRGSGRLPQGEYGRVLFRKLRDEAERFVEIVRPFLEGGPCAPLAANVELDDPNTFVTGRLQHIYPQGQVFYRGATIKAKDLLNAWVHHLAFNAVEEWKGERTTLLIGKEEQLSIPGLNPETARKHLNTLVALFLKGMQMPLPFFPETSRAFVADYLKKKDTGSALTAARKKWVSGQNHRGDVEDPYVRLCFGSDMPGDENFREAALAVFEKMMSDE